MRSLPGRSAALLPSVGAAVLVASVALQLGVAAPASAILPPTAYTGEAAQLSYSTATLKGAVNPRGQPTTYFAQYGTSSAYGGQSAIYSAGGGSQTVHVVIALDELSPGTTYHYRLLAANASGLVGGADRTFTTKKIPLLFRIPTMPTTHVFGRPFSVTGILTGSGSAERPIVLQANPFPYLGGFETLGSPGLSDARGAFSFRVAGLDRNTQLRVATLGTPPALGPVMVQLIAVRVTLHLRHTRRAGFVRLYGTVAPAQVGAHVSFQMLRRARSPLNVGGTAVRRAGSTVSRFSRVLRIRRAGSYRAVVHVLSGAQVSNHSRAVLVR